MLSWFRSLGRISIIGPRVDGIEYIKLNQNKIMPHSFPAILEIPPTPYQLRNWATSTFRIVWLNHIRINKISLLWKDPKILIFKRLSSPIWVSQLFPLEKKKKNYKKCILDFSEDLQSIIPTKYVKRGLCSKFLLYSRQALKVPIYVHKNFVSVYGCWLSSK